MPWISYWFYMTTIALILHRSRKRVWRMMNEGVTRITWLQKDFHRLTDEQIPIAPKKYSGLHFGSNYKIWIRGRMFWIICEWSKTESHSSIYKFSCEKFGEKPFTFTEMKACVSSIRAGLNRDNLSFALIHSINPCSDSRTAYSCTIAKDHQNSCTIGKEQK